MRYLKLIFLVLLVFLSKQVIQSDQVIDLETHSKMYRDFETILSDAILTAVPTAKEIEYAYIRSDILTEDVISIYFSTSFLESDAGEVEIILEGSAKLNRIYENNEATRKWTLDSFQLGDEEIAFQEEIVIEVDRSQLK